ncbi:hypothetical protein HNR56_001703 [Roseospira marina]|nr:hypothetical protein [Roseospira marina]MBB5087010.1 hypothetical protein [Roseospira marina]
MSPATRNALGRVTAALEGAATARADTDGEDPENGALV